MKNLLVSLALFGVLLVFGLFIFKQTTEAQNNITARLLDLPAPPNVLIENIEPKRPENFYDKNNPPRDDASVDETLDYWKTQSINYSASGYNIKPSERALETILAEIEKKPEMLSEFLNILPAKPEAADLVKRIYDSKLSGSDAEESENYSAGEIKKWLTFNSNYFADELFRQAQKTSETAEYVTNQEEVLALARVDWDRARPLLEKMRGDDGKPVSQTLARWAFYQHAIAEKDSGAIEKYRRELQQTVENKSGKPGERDLAMDALVQSGDFDGRDDWYYTLLADETLYDLRINDSSYTGLTTILNQSPSGRYTAKMLELVKSENPAVRNAAVRNLTTLLGDKNPDVIRALLPWLENPEWAKGNGSARQMLIGALADFTMPESVPGLIAVLNEKTSPENTGRLRGEMSNGSMSNAAPSVNYNSATTAAADSYLYRSAAISALAKQKDARAVSALRLVLPQVEVFERAVVVGALLACGGFSVAEQIEALELVAKNTNRQSKDIQSEKPTADSGASMSNRPGSEYSGIESRFNKVESEWRALDNVMSNASHTRPYNPSEIKLLLGGLLAASAEVSSELAAAMVDRIDYLDAKNAPLAFALRKIMLNWQGAAVNSLFLRDLKNGKAETGAVVKLLSLRKELREKQPNDIFDIRGGSATALGISACLLEDNNEYDAILAGDNDEAKTAMLACARLIRAGMPVRKVAENLQSPNAALAIAAERYLESEDSAEARRIVLARRPNEAKILGATTYFAANDKAVEPEIGFLAELFASVINSTRLAPYYYLYDDSGALKIAEKKLQKEVTENRELLGIYSYNDNFIRIYKDKADFSWEEDAARYRERALSETEFNRFKAYLSANRADELPPFLSFCEESCQSKELLMLGRNGGRRVFFKGDEPPNFFKELGALFDEMRKQPAKLHYRLEKDIAGLDVLFAGDRLRARAIWKDADDFRVLLEDPERGRQIETELRKQFQADDETAEEDADHSKITEERRRRAEQREFESFAWHKIEKNKLADVAAQPPQVEFIPPPRDQFPARATSRRWKARAANLELRASEDGLYKISRGQMSRIQSGFYTNPVIAPNGLWAVAAKYFPETGIGVVRVNLLTGKEFKVKLDGYPNFEAVAFIPSVNKVLIFANSYEGEPEKTIDRKGAYFLLDAQTGIVQPVKGEIRPLAQQTFRPLQAAANADEFWAAIPGGEKNETRIGIYNAKTFSFKSLLTVPQIRFDSMDMQADEKESKIYFVYNGHLLSLPLPRAETK